MKELQNQLKKLKAEAVMLMIDGKITKYLAKLKQITDMQMQIDQLSVAA